MEVLLEETREQVLAWIEVEEMRLCENDGSQLQRFRDRVEGCRDLASLVHLQIQLWTSLGYKSEVLTCLRNIGEVSSLGRRRLGNIDVGLEVLAFVWLLKVMPSLRRTGLWPLQTQLKKGLRPLGYDAVVVSYAELILEWADKAGYLALRAFLTRDALEEGEDDLVLCELLEERCLYRLKGRFRRSRKIVIRTYTFLL